MNNLSAYIDENKVDAKIIDLGVSMPTAAAAAEQLKVPVGSIFKSVVLSSANDESYIIVLPGDREIDIKATEKLLEVENLKLASKDVVLRDTGYPAGGLPPFGHAKNLKVVVDNEVLTYPKGYGGGGRHELLVEINPDELIRVSNAKVASVIKKQTENRIKKILVDDLFVDLPMDEIGIDDSLRETIGLDSLSFMELRVQCEKIFDIEITDEQFVPEHFGTIRTLINLINELKSS